MRRSENERSRQRMDTGWEKEREKIFCAWERKRETQRACIGNETGEIRHGEYDKKSVCDSV